MYGIGGPSMIVYGKNVFETLKENPQEILDLYIQNLSLIHI